MNTECAEWKHKAKDIGILTLRILVGLAMASHGYQKVFGGQVVMLSEGIAKMGMPMPNVLAWMAALSEFAGGLLIALGLGTRIASFFVFFTMCVAFFGAHESSFAKGGELAYMFGAATLSLILIGGGRYSLDSLCCCRKHKETAPGA